MKPARLRLDSLMQDSFWSVRFKVSFQVADRINASATLFANGGSQRGIVEDDFSEDERYQHSHR